MPGFTRENHEKGLLIDDEWMAGISKEPEGFSVFVVDHRSSALIAQQIFPELDLALAAVNQIPRGWKFESANGCSGDRCADGKCKGEGCKIYIGPKKASATSCGPDGSR
jgi:hypothetical protein